MTNDDLRLGEFFSLHAQKGRKAELQPASLPQRRCSSGWEIAGPNPNVAARCANKTVAPHLPTFTWKTWHDAIWIEDLDIRPTDLSSFWINLLGCLFSNAQPLVSLTLPIVRYLPL